MIFTIGCLCSVSKSGQFGYSLFSAKLNLESGKKLYTKVLEDFISFSTI